MVYNLLMGLQQLGKNIKKARIKAELTQEEVAEKAGVHVSYYSRIERGVVNPSHEILDNIRKALKMNPSDLFPA